jgi:two-component system, OmpR family, torCAD operon response regulator TorR
MQQTKILIVEDDPVTSSLIAAYFKKEDYHVTEVVDGEEMFAALDVSKFDIILLDINLPGEDGISLTRELRTKSDVGIILVSSRSEDIDRIVGLEMGADDYVVKPFNDRELLARVKRVLKRTSRINQQEENTIYKFNGWVLECDTRRLTSPDNEPVHLTNGEFTLLLSFVRNPGAVLSRQKLLKEVSSREWMPSDRTIDVMLSRLRHKIEADHKDPKLLVTMHGVGYSFMPE